jgi:hypothetical protein
MVCKGNVRCLEDPTCYLTKMTAKRRAYCKKRMGKRSCRGRPLDVCFSEKCLATKGPTRFYCRRRTKRV